MKRDRGYYRRQRAKQIRRKERILYGLGGHETVYAWERGVPGRLAKGKIHCSCPMCRTKSYDYLGRRDLRANEKAQEMCRELMMEGGVSVERRDTQKTE